MYKTINRGCNGCCNNYCNYPHPLTYIKVQTVIFTEEHQDKSTFQCVPSKYLWLPYEYNWSNCILILYHLATLTITYTITKNTYFNLIVSPERNSRATMDLRSSRVRVRCVRRDFLVNTRFVIRFPSNFAWWYSTDRARNLLILVAI